MVMAATDIADGDGGGSPVSESVLFDIICVVLASRAIPIPPLLKLIAQYAMPFFVEAVVVAGWDERSWRTGGAAEPQDGARSGPLRAGAARYDRIRRHKEVSVHKWWFGLVFANAGIASESAVRGRQITRDKLFD